MGCRVIPLESYARREHFEYFMSLAQPHVQITVPVDITDWDRRRREKGLPFFLPFLYKLEHAANAVPELRQRIRDGGIVQYDYCTSSFTAALPDGTYRYCTADASLPFERYMAEARAAQQRAMENAHLEEEDDPEGQFFISCTPKLHFSAVTLPVPAHGFSVPCIEIGRYVYEDCVCLKDGQIGVEKRVTLPVALQVHHALVDGDPISRFYERLNEELRGPVDA